MSVALQTKQSDERQAVSARPPEALMTQALASRNQESLKRQRRLDRCMRSLALQACGHNALARRTTGEVSVRSDRNESVGRIGLVLVLMAGCATTSMAQPLAASATATARQNLSLEVTGPNPVPLSAPSRFRIVVRNHGEQAIGPVDVRAVLPDYLDPRRAAPLPTLNNSELIWRLESIPAQELRTVTFEAVCTRAAPVLITVSATAPTTATFERRVAAPEMEAVIRSTEEAIVGETFPCEVILNNPGPAWVDNGGLEVFHSEGLRVAATGGNVRRAFRIGPGQSMSVRLSVQATKRGRQGIMIKAEADGVKPVKAERRLRIRGPEFDVELIGPKQHPVAQPAEVVVTVGNIGDGAAEKTLAFLELPPNVELIRAGEGGRYDATQRAVIWRIGSLPSGYEVRLTTQIRSIASGATELRGSAKDASGTNSDSVLETRWITER
jgi:hypothetical protein